MGKRDGQDERVMKILGETVHDTIEKSIDRFYDYLKANLSFPCEVTGIEDFRWEEFYVFGPGNKKEYEKLKKNRPSYTDKYQLLDIVRDADSEWMMCYGEDIGACIRRIADGKKFVMGLSELKATDKKTKNYELIDDYAVWFVNNR